MSPSLASTGNNGPSKNAHWSSYYETWNHEMTHWLDAGTSIAKSRKMKTIKDLRDVINLSPQMGLLLCDERGNMLVTHAITMEDDKFYGLYGNTIESPPLDLIITNGNFKTFAEPSAAKKTLTRDRQTT
jgi:hypothetical protein